MAEIAIKIQIGNREYPLRVQEENVSIIEQVAKNVNAAIESRKRQLGISDIQDALAMTVFDCFVKQKANENNLATPSTNDVSDEELQVLNHNIKNALSL